jgi:hypothetical protein
MQVPWRAAEAMHWQLGEIDMARRAGVVPFSLNMTSNEPQGPQAQQPRISPTRGHAHSQSQGSLPRDFAIGLPSPRYPRGPPAPPPGHIIPPLIPPPTPTSARPPLPSRRESLPPRPPFGPPLSDQLQLQLPQQQQLQQQPEYDYSYGLAPIQTAITTPSSSLTSLPQGGGPGAGPPPPRGSSLLPSVAELTTGVSPYTTPAYTLGAPPTLPHPQLPPPAQQQQRQQSSTSPTRGSPATGTGSPAPGSGTASGSGSGSLLPALSPYPPLDPPSAATGGVGIGMGKRRASPADTFGAGAGAAREARRGSRMYPRSSGAGVDDSVVGGAGSSAGGMYPPVTAPATMPFGMGLGMGVSSGRRGTRHGP